MKVCLWLAAAAASATSLPAPAPCPEVIAQVNGRPVTLERVRSAAQKALARDPSLDRGQTLRFSLDGVITGELLLQEAEKRGLYDPKAGQAPEEATHALLVAEAEKIL